ncbi:MAG: cupin domain-containing protein [Christensenellaceae bacterium]|jgi:quercetin dioxygenase-like cupin family protein
MIIKKSKNVPMNLYFDPENQANKLVQMGKLTLMPGERRPAEGFAMHVQDEYSYVISGEAHSVLEDGSDLVGKPGDAQLIEAGEKHYNYNDTDKPAEVVWMLVERVD